jgi:Xaa-Pro dipeptidase
MSPECRSARQFNVPGRTLAPRASDPTLWPSYRGACILSTPGASGFSSGDTPSPSEIALVAGAAGQPVERGADRAMQGRDYLRALTSTPAPKELAFPVSEYRERVDKVRARMAAVGLDLLLVTHPPNLCYLTGYNTFAVGRHACLLLPPRGEPVIQVSAMAIPAALFTGWLERIEPYDWHEVDRIPERIAALVREQGLERARIGLELARLLARIHAEVRRHLPGATFEDASGLVFDVRLVKSPAELDCMRRAARMTVAGIEASYRAIVPGGTDNDVARAGYDAMVAAGSEFLAVEPIVTSGHRSGWAHTTFKRTPLKVGDVVFLEYGGCYQRYTAPLMRTAVIGEPDAAVRRAAEAARATVELIIDRCGPAEARTRSPGLPGGGTPPSVLRSTSRRSMERQLG